MSFRARPEGLSEESPERGFCRSAELGQALFAASFGDSSADLAAGLGMT